ncbi:MAG TPA: hypothetical protein VJA66_11500, partial [Thermoanaerobaculia bacterium]
IGVNALVFLGLLLLLEAGNQVLGVARPSYDVLFLQPDRVVGWKQVPNLHWTWARPDFSVRVDTNSLGFRDVPREIPKPQDVKRVALLGDSFIEAVQVPLSLTAGQILEHRLNSTLARGSTHLRQWEVLNFGISAFSVGQYLLTWEQYASQYRPDLVVALVSWVQMRRTTAKFEYGAFAATKGERLWVRPTFRIEDGALVREPARDFERFEEAQAKVMAGEFEGKRMHRRGRPLLTITSARLILDRLATLSSPLTSLSKLKSPLPQRAPRVNLAEVKAVNLEIICELGRQVENEGAKLVILDMTQYLSSDPDLSSELDALCTKKGFGYVPVYRDLLNANRKGVATRWAHDGHFNEAGNRILADALYQWIGESASGNRTAAAPLTGRHADS